MTEATNAFPAAIIPFFAPVPPAPPLPPTETYITMYIKSVVISHDIKYQRVKGRKITNELGTVTTRIEEAETE